MNKIEKSNGSLGGSLKDLDMSLARVDRGKKKEDKQAGYPLNHHIPRLTKVKTLLHQYAYGPFFVKRIVKCHNLLQILALMKYMDLSMRIMTKKRRKKDFLFN